MPEADGGVPPATAAGSSSKHPDRVGGRRRGEQLVAAGGSWQAKQQVGVGLEAFPLLPAQYWVQTEATRFTFGPTAEEQQAVQHRTGLYSKFLQRCLSTRLATDSWGRPETMSTMATASLRDERCRFLCPMTSNQAAPTSFIFSLLCSLLNLVRLFRSKKDGRKPGRQLWPPSVPLCQDTPKASRRGGVVSPSS